MHLYRSLHLLRDYEIPDVFSAEVLWNNAKDYNSSPFQQVNTYSADVKDYVSIEEAIQTACRDSGNLEILILSHGISVPGTFEDTSFETIDNILDTNLKGNINVLKCALPLIKSSTSEPASITMFSSQAGQVYMFLFLMSLNHVMQNVIFGSWCYPMHSRTVHKKQ